MMTKGKVHGLDDGLGNITIIGSNGLPLTQAEVDKMAKAALVESKRWKSSSTGQKKNHLKKLKGIK